MHEQYKYHLREIRACISDGGSSWLGRGRARPCIPVWEAGNPGAGGRDRGSVGWSREKATVRRCESDSVRLGARGERRLGFWVRSAPGLEPVPRTREKRSQAWACGTQRRRLGSFCRRVDGYDGLLFWYHHMVPPHGVPSLTRTRGVFRGGRGTGNAIDSPRIKRWGYKHEGNVGSGTRRGM